MKKILCLIIMMFSMSCFAQQITSQDALQIAVSLFKKQNFNNSVEAITPYNNAEGETLYFIVNASPASYAIISATELVNPVIAWSVTSQFDAEMPFAKILEVDIEHRILLYSMLTENQKHDIQEQWISLRNSEYRHPAVQSWPEEGTTASGGWIETLWTQTFPYNIMCPMDSVTNSRSYAGCPAIVMGQIINYLKTTMCTRFDDNDDYHHNYSGRNYNIDDDAELIDFPSFPELNIWLDSIDVVFNAGKDATDSLAAAIVFACGTACTQVYTSIGSGTFAVSQAFEAYKRFGFDKCELYETTDPAMYAKLISNMKNGFPAHLAVVDAAWQTGHNVAVDGYREDGYYHINFGWGGSCNGWWLIPDPNFPYSLSVLEGIVLDIIPDNIGVTEITHENNTIFYPNPADDMIYLKDNLVTNSKYFIYSINGQKVQSGFTDGNIFIGNLKNGLYILKLQTAGEISCTKLIIR